MGLGDYYDHVSKRGDIYCAATDVDYLLMANPKFWENGGDEKFLSSTNAEIGVVSNSTYKEAYQVGMDSIGYYWKELKTRYVQPPGEKYARPLDYREFRNDIKPVIFVAPPPPKPGSFSAEQHLWSILCSFYDEIQPIFAPDWRYWGSVFPTLSTEHMLMMLDNLMKLELKNEILEVERRVFIIVGLEKAYCEETHDAIKEFLEFLELRFIRFGSNKVLLFCETPFNAKDLLGHHASVVVDYEQPSKPPSDPEISESMSELEIGDFDIDKHEWEDLPAHLRYPYEYPDSDYC
ncbi:hypothetical protein F4821DRAFT_277255 [Hypoxylon rubiginosum]|uniref:Uncharacterized protein n=1 Tax=Hypoxylon rubiginosum TaxID=110542 RepID=A0ACC0D6F3_9PEZI|nr:hypothetical protein F4821DRAFT_277255 [Hypoxylon rubiginosum]